jgi:hypothetical protein
VVAKNPRDFDKVHLKTRRNSASLLVIPRGFFFRPEASAPWMAKGFSPLQLSYGWRAPGRNEKAQGKEKL